MKNPSLLTVVVCLVLIGGAAGAAVPGGPVAGPMAAEPAVAQYVARCLRFKICREAAWEALKELVAAVWRATKSDRFTDVLTLLDDPVRLGQRLDAIEAILVAHQAMTPALARHLETVRAALEQ